MLIEPFATSMWSFWSRDPTKDFPYEIGDIVTGLEDVSIWVLHKGKKKVSLSFLLRLAILMSLIHDMHVMCPFF